jgi:hypothetical protein
MIILHRAEEEATSLKMRLLLIATLSIWLTTSASEAVPGNELALFQQLLSQDNLLGLLDMEALSDKCQNQTRVLQRLNPVTAMTDTYWNLKSKIFV